ncbi:Uncharacterised protein [uncultured archaeon]|nr:Uncharacterised protein [uncultured archaeon]
MAARNRVKAFDMEKRAPAMADALIAQLQSLIKDLKRTDD